MISQSAAQAERQIPSDLKKKADIIIIIIIIMVASITSYTSSRYLRGHGLVSIFKGLFHSAIPLPKGPGLQASVHLAGNMFQGKTIKPALKNRIAP